MPPKTKSDQTKSEVPKCYACRHAIKTSFNAYLHPLLKILVCRKCYISYGTGDFSQFEDGVDSSGDDNYCRLCVDGGDLYVCANSRGDSKATCHYCFCKMCIKRICPKDPVVDVDTSTEFKWVCLACDPDRIAELKKLSLTAINNLSKDLKRAPEIEEVTGTATKKRRTESEGGHAKDLNTSQQDKSRSLRAGDSADGTRKHDRSSLSSSEKSRSLKGDAIPTREPETMTMPPLEKPRPPKTSLRNLGGPKTSITPQSKTPSTQTTPASKPPTQTTPASKPSTQTTPALKPSSQTTPALKPSTQTIPASKSFSSTSSVTVIKTVPAPSSPFPTTPVTKNVPVPVVTPVSKPPTTTAASSTNTTTSQASVAKLTPVSSAVTVQPQSNVANNSMAKVNSDKERQTSTQGQPQNIILKPRPNSKQLKVNSEPVTPKLVLSQRELKKRLAQYGNVKDNCVKEIHSKFNTILEIFESVEAENKSLLRCEIDDIKRPIMDILEMVNNLEGLSRTQI